MCDAHALFPFAEPLGRVQKRCRLLRQLVNAILGVLGAVSVAIACLNLLPFRPLGGAVAWTVVPILLRALRARPDRRDQPRRLATAGNPNSTGNALADALLGNYRTYAENELDPIASIASATSKPSCPTTGASADAQPRAGRSA